MSRILNHLNIQNKIKAILHQIHSVFSTTHCEGTNKSKSGSFSNDGEIHSYFKSIT